MQILAVELFDFRNLASVRLEPHPRFNVISGDNGQGKTNLLEGLYLLGTLRSFRATRLDEMVRFAAERLQARARVARAGLERVYEVEVGVPLPGAAARKLAKVDGKPTRSSAEYFGGYNVVLFSPDDLRLPRGAPAGRRRYLDRAVWNASPAYLKQAQSYEKILRSRNAVLRDGPPKTGDLLDVYDEQLARAGAVLVDQRRRYLAAIAPLVAAAYERFTHSGLFAEVRYRCSVTMQSGQSGQSGQGGEDFCSEFLSSLKRSRAKDLAIGHTSVGPHSDDLELDLDGRPARLHASQGQLRSFLLALKVAEIQHLETVLSGPPILLLDDVSSELDPTRNAMLFEFLTEVPCQVFITTTSREHVRLDSERRDYRVFSGRIEVTDKVD